jgi:hypothetical protein
LLTLQHAAVLAAQALAATHAFSLRFASEKSGCQYDAKTDNEKGPMLIHDLVQ